MRIKFYLFSLLTLLLSTAAVAQKGAIKGQLISSQRAELAGVEVTLHPSNKTIRTDSKGYFFFEELKDGVYTVTVSAADYQGKQFAVNVEHGVSDLGEVTLQTSFTTTGIDDFEISDYDPEDVMDASSMGVLLSASKDVFDNIAGYKFGSVRFRPRGYDQNLSGVYLNGIYFNDATSGYSPWSLWSGLNDAVRNQEFSTGSAMHANGIGGIAGTTEINARASEVRQGFRVSVVNASALYRFRVMASYGSGVKDNGWSYAFNVSTRQGGNNWARGVYYNSWAYYAGVEKKFDNHHSLALTVFATPGERGAQGASTQEAYDLAGTNFYNPNWGYQDGTKAMDRRSARVRHTHEPVAILNYTFEPNEKFKMEVATSLRFGKNGYTALDWYDTADPRPDYYRYLPSYYDNPNPDYNDPYKEDITAWGWEWNNSIRQIDWQTLYWVNSNSEFGDLMDQMEYRGEKFWNGVMPDVENDRRSKYAIEERRQDQLDFNASLNTDYIINAHHRLKAGYNVRVNRTEFYKKMHDLLGGTYWLDIDNFAERDYEDQIQNNLFTPNRLVKKGDKYGYDYYAHVRDHKLWASYELDKGKWNVHVGLEGGYTKFWREGLYKKALFEHNSYGNSEKHDFWTYTAKLGVNFMPLGNQMIYANIVSMQNAPYFRNAFLSARSRNSSLSNLTNEKIFSVDLNYAIRLPELKLRVTGYFTQVKDRTNVFSYYDDEARAFSNLAMTGIDQRHFGLELGLDVPIVAGISGRVAFAMGEHTYSNEPLMSLTRDNIEKVFLKDERVHWKNKKIEGTPQTALSLGLNYRGPHGIWAGIDANYFGNTYLGMSPIRRIDKSHVNLTDDKIIAMTSQEKLANNWVVNANISKNWWFKGYSLGISLEVKNLLNNKDLRTGGYEQTRLRRIHVESEKEYFQPFDSKYYYMYGINYYLNVFFRF